jgi:hypothetical protein
VPLELDIKGLVQDALTNMERYWKNREHFVYLVEYIAGHDLAKADRVKCGITIMCTIEEGEHRWIMTLELPNGPPVVGNADDIDGVWKWFKDLRDTY